MTAGYFFISHATADKAFVRELREALEGLKHSVWVDTRNLRGGDVLDAEIERAIREASGVVVVLSKETVNSLWVRREIAVALAVQQDRGAAEYRVLPLLLPGMKPAALGLWFDREPLAVPIELGVGQVAEALPAILAGLGLRLPDEEPSWREVATRPVDELILELRDPAFGKQKGVQRATATATLVYRPAGEGQREIESQRYKVTAPLGPIELEEIRWYLEEYYRWPVGLFKERAERTEAALPGWGRDLYSAAFAADAAQKALAAWRDSPNDRRFSIWVDADPPEGAKPKRRDEAAESASLWLSLPWELLHDGDDDNTGGYLLHGGNPVPVRRRLPNRREQPVRLAQVPIRILLLSPRPELDEDGKTPVGYFDHRASALPLVSAVENLGELARLTVLNPPTLPALEAELRRAKQSGDPYEIVHFDGHGVYDRKVGLGALLFEHPADAAKIGQRRSQLVHAERLAPIMRDHGIPLVFLEACQTAQLELNPTASVAARLLNEGVNAVAAMRASVLVETARRFVQTFYQQLALGQSVGRAFLAGQMALESDRERIPIMGASKLHLHDWFVPVLYQEQDDPPLFRRLPSDRAGQLQSQRRSLALGDLPPTPPHQFIGRSRELLRLERLLAESDPRYAVLRGTGGIGKTTLAVELARWLSRSHRCQRVAFASLEQLHDDRSLLDALGRQLLPEGGQYSVAEYSSLDQALQPVERALRDHATVLVIDNVETVLGKDEGGRMKDETADAPVHPSSFIPHPSIFALCRRLLDAHPATRILFTSREALPTPFDSPAATLELGRLSRNDAVELVEKVMANHGLTPPAADDGRTAEEITALVEAVHGHARALVLLAPEIARSGVRAATADLHPLMAELERLHPGDRENSLYASVELSLRRLPPEIRQALAPLAACHDGVSLIALALMLAGDVESEADFYQALLAAQAIARHLVGVGLAEHGPYGYLRLDPALAPYLSLSGVSVPLAVSGVSVPLAEPSPPQADSSRHEALLARWAAAMLQQVDYLYRQGSQDAQQAAQLTLQDEPNLLALLAWLPGHASPEEIVDTAGRIEQLFANLGRPAALAAAVAARQTAADHLSEWSHAGFEHQRLAIERQLASGDLPGAYQAATFLQQQALAAGETPYPEAAYDIAFAHILLGRVLVMGGQAHAALPPLAEAQRRFETLAVAGNTSAAGMATVAITEQADCLTTLGRLDEAAAAYEQGIALDEKRGDKRAVAVGTLQLGTVRMLQERYADALAAYDAARTQFESLGEPGTVATAWHQIGMVHKRARHFDAAERAYRQSLAIEVQHHNRSSEASSLGELGNLYNAWNKPEQAVTFYRQAADIYTALGDQAMEGRVRNNTAETLRSLGRHDEARPEIQRAIECKKPYSHAAQPWKTFAILHQIEEATGNASAAATAWRDARNAYLAYRRDGGYAQTDAGEVCEALWQAIQQGGLETGLAIFRQVTAKWNPTATLDRIQAILDGNRDPTLADDPELHFDDSADLLLLLERLQRT